MARVSEFLRLLELGDAGKLMKAWHRVAPHLPQPRNRRDAEITMHLARDAAESVSVKAKLYSRAWLRERDLPTLGPDPEQKIAEVVGISVGFRSPILKPAADEIRKAMETAVEECYANGETQVPFLQARMGEAKDKATRALFG